METKYDYATIGIPSAANKVERIDEQQMLSKNVGICIDPYRNAYQCVVCGFSEWFPNNTNGRRPRGYRHCPINKCVRTTRLRDYFFNKRELKERGWTDKLIAELLGEPHYLWNYGQCGIAKCYFKDCVLSLESSEEFHKNKNLPSTTTAEYGDAAQTSGGSP